MLQYFNCSVTLKYIFFVAIPLALLFAFKSFFKVVNYLYLVYASLPFIVQLVIKWLLH